MKSIFVSWKTTLGGALLALGYALEGAGEAWIQTLSSVLLVLGGLMVGVAARDNNISSEKAGATPAK